MATKPRKTKTRIALALVAVVFIALAVFIYFFDLDAYKPEVERIASQVTGMEVTIEGAIRFRFRPGLTVKVEGLRVRNRATELVTVRSLFVAMDYGPLFRGEVIPKSLVLDGVTATIERAADGTYNFDVPGSADAGERPELRMANIRIDDLNARYVDHQAGAEVTAEECAVLVPHIHLPAAAPPTHVNLQAEVACARVATVRVAATDLTATIRGEDGLFVVDPIGMVLFEGVGVGSLGANLRGERPAFEVSYQLGAFDLGAFLALLTPDSNASGRLDLTSTLTLAGAGLEEWRRSAAGEVSVRGVNLEVIGMDIDQQLAAYESSQSFNLIDAGAFFFAGPLGVAVTKGHDFSRVLTGGGGRTRITNMVSAWRVNRGVASARDVALATVAHRMALKGDLDFVNQRFEHMTVAVLDERGCAKVQQTLRGPFASPTVDAPSAVSALTGPVRRLFGRARDLLPGASARAAECEVFYAGSVPAPTSAPAP